MKTIGSTVDPSTPPPVTPKVPAQRRPVAVGIIGRRAGRSVTTIRTAAGTVGSVASLPVRPKPPVIPLPQASLPVAFTTASGAPASLDNMAKWQPADFDTLEVLDVTAPFLSEVGVAALARVEAGVAQLSSLPRVPGPVVEAVRRLERSGSSVRRWRAERHLEAVLAERKALIGVSA
jgi:hypothetical protein